VLTLTHVLIAIAVVTGYGLFALARPSGTCWRCFGARSLRPRAAKGRKPPKPRPCPVCKGQGWAPTPGARLVHGLYQELLGQRARDRRRERGTRYLESKEDPPC